MARQVQTVRIPAGQGGLNASRSPIQVLNIDLVDCNNLTYEYDTWQKDGGAVKINTTAVSPASSVIWLWDFMSDGGVQELVGATADGRLITVTTSGVGKTLVSGLATNRMTSGAEGVAGGAATKTLFVVNGSDMMKMYQGGAAASDVTTPPADWTTYRPSWCFLHNNRMYAGGRAHTIYATVLGNHADYTTFPGSLTFSCYPGEGERIVGGVSWRGRAFFFKYPKGIYYLDDSSADTTQWQLKRLSRYVGASGPGAILEAADDVYFISPDFYIHALSAVREFGDARSSAVLPNELGIFLRENVNAARLSRTQSAFYALKRKILFALSGTGSAVHNLLVGLDIHRMQSFQGFKSTRDECEALAIRKNPSTNLAKPVAGTSTGYIYELDTDSRSKDGAGYEGRFETRDMELYEGAIRRANLRELELEFVPQGNWNLSMDVYRDGVFSETKTFAMSGQGGVLDSFILDTDVLGIAVLQNHRARLSGDCRRVKLAGYNSGANESFGVAGMTLKFTPGNDR